MRYTLTKEHLPTLKKQLDKHLTEWTFNSFYFKMAIGTESSPMIMTHFWEGFQAGKILTPEEVESKIRPTFKITKNKYRCSLDVAIKSKTYQCYTASLRELHTTLRLLDQSPSPKVTVSNDSVEDGGHDVDLYYDNGEGLSPKKIQVIHEGKSSEEFRADKKDEKSYPDTIKLVAKRTFKGVDLVDEADIDSII